MSLFINCFTKWILLMVTVVLTCSEDQVLQTPTILRAVKGENVNITYSYWYNRSKAEMMSVSWWRNMWKKPLCRILYTNKMPTWSSECNSRVNISLELSANVTHFFIRDLQLNDADLYYCRIVFLIPPPTHEIQGDTTSLIVEAPPEVEVKFLPRPENGCCIQLVCRAENFYPDNIQLRWRKEGKEGSAWINSEITMMSNNSNSRTSYINLSDWQKEDIYSCHVNHSMLQSPLIKRITIPFDGQHEGRVYIWWVLAFLCLTLVTVVGYLLLKYSRKGAGSKGASPESSILQPYQSVRCTWVLHNRRKKATTGLLNVDSEDIQIYVNFVAGSRKETTASECQHSNRNSNSNYSFIRHIPLVVYENTFSEG
ncbi:uncharacterized protein [Heterodontus francisci]|uniref:uncharacterized protein n=1 Tax=Heterodontus francisci TaxID=7792 RepID=UPI00355B8795